MNFHVRTDTGIMYATIDSELFNALDSKGYRFTRTRGEQMIGADGKPLLCN